MKQYNNFEEALAAQENEGGYDNTFHGWSSDNSLIANIPFALKPVLWLIMATDSYLGDYEEYATEYGVDAFGRWAALSDSHCSCFGRESSADHITYYNTLDDLLRADPEYDLGITGTMKIAHLAEALGVDVELHASGPAHRHCMAAIRNTSFYEVALVGPRARNPLPPVYASDYSEDLEAVGADGCFPVPDGPGLGVVYDWDWIAAHRTATHVFPSK